MYVEMPLTAAASVVDKKNAQDVRRLIQPWQAQAMAYYDLVMEVKFATNYFAQMLSGVRLFPAMIDPETHEPEEVDSGPLVDLFEQIIDTSGGRATLQEQYARLQFLIGETYLTVSPDRERGQVWECLSPNELRPQPGGYATRFRAPMLSADQYKIGVSKYIVGNDPETIEAYGGEVQDPQFSDDGPDIINVYRLWRPSAAYTDLADCNMHAAMDILEELVLSTYSVRAQLKSRLYQSGVLVYPDEMMLPSLGNDPEDDPNSDDFMARLNQAVVTAIRDPGSASAMSPIGLRVSDQFAGKIEFIRFNDNQGALAEIQQRGEMIGRFATCVEIPKEILTGLEESNHWTAWLIDEQSYKAYGRPGALRMAADLNAAFLQPAAREAGLANWQDVCIGVDPSEVINHPDRAKDADALYNGRAISKQVWRESKGYNDNDAMPDDELNEMLGVQIRDGSLAVYGIPSVRANIEPTEGDIESATGEVEASTPADSSGADIERGAPQSGPPAQADQAGPALQASAAVSREQRILGAAEMAVQRGREMAGARLKSAVGPRFGKCDECQEAIKGVPNWDVAHTLGVEKSKPFLSSPGPGTTGNGALVDGTAQFFAAMLEQMGVSAGWASDLGELVEQHAARTLFQAVPYPLPAGFAKLLSRIDRPLERT